MGLHHSRKSFSANRIAVGLFKIHISANRIAVGLFKIHIPASGLDNCPMSLTECQFQLFRLAFIGPPPGLALFDNGGPH